MRKSLADPLGNIFYIPQLPLPCTHPSLLHSDEVLNGIQEGIIWASLVAQMVKNPPVCNTGDLGLVPGLGRYPGGGCGNPLPYSCLENPQGQRSLAGYSPCGHKESDLTERLSTVQQGIIQSTFLQ